MEWTYEWQAAPATEEWTPNEKLCVQIQQGDATAKLQLLQQNEGMIHTIAWRERRRYAYLSLELEDLWSAGRMGLLRAANLYQPDSGNQFVTYAWIHVRQAVQREIIGGGTLVRIPVHLHDRMHKLSVYRVPYTAVNYRTLAERVTSEEQEGHGLTEKEIQEYMCLVEPFAMIQSLNDPLTLNGETERQDMVAQPDAATPEDMAVQSILLEQCPCRLSSREKQVIVLRYGLAGENAYTLLEVGKKLGITKERVRQLEKRALEKMRRWLEETPETA